MSVFAGGFWAACLETLETWGRLWSGNVWRTCWQGGAFILLAWLVCRLLPALPARVRHWLWLLACLKLVVGLLWAAPLRLPASAVRIVPTFVASFEPSVPHAPLLTGVGRGSGSVPSLPASAAALSLSPRGLLMSLWMGGILISALLSARQMFGLRGLCRRARRLDNAPPGIQARELGVLMGLARPPRIAASDEVTAPLVIGPLRPLVLLPADFAARYSPEETRLALAHELAHVRGGDLWLALVPALAQILFFFFPPVWVACREWATAREAARDLDALAVTGASPALYGQLLFKLAAQDSAPGGGSLRGALGATASYHTLKRRLLWIAQRGQKENNRPPALTLLLMVPCALLFAPWRIQAASALAPAASVPASSLPASGSASAPAEASGAVGRAADPALVPAQGLRALSDPRKRYLLIGAGTETASSPPDGYHLLVVLPGGAGNADFQYFVKRVQAWGLPPGYLVAELIAPQWTARQSHDLVWPTRTNTLPGVGFPTETFVEDVIRDVKAHYAVNARHVYTLGWASGGPACYATALQASTQTRGAFIAMSVFVPDSLPALTWAQGRRFYLQQPLDTPMAPLEMAAQARARLRDNRADVELVTVEGGYGWHGPVYKQIRRGIDWLEQN